MDTTDALLGIISLREMAKINLELRGVSSEGGVQNNTSKY